MRDPHRDLVDALAHRHHAKAAWRALMAAGKRALPAVREGLRHANADVRYHCCRFLDHFLAPQDLGDLIAMLRDEDPQVRASSLHSLACDRCKEGDCRLDEDQVLPHGLNLLAGDASAQVRAMAVEVVGRWVHSRPEAVAALQAAIASDPSPAVRKKARWFAPGGPIHARTAPKPRRALSPQLSG